MGSMDHGKSGAAVQVHVVKAEGIDASSRSMYVEVTQHDEASSAPPSGVIVIRQQRAAVCFFILRKTTRSPRKQQAVHATPGLSRIRRPSCFLPTLNHLPCPWCGTVLVRAPILLARVCLTRWACLDIGARLVDRRQRRTAYFEKCEYTAAVVLTQQQQEIRVWVPRVLYHYILLLAVVLAAPLLRQDVDPRRIHHPNVAV